MQAPRCPDGVVVDVEAGHVYWTNMGNPSVDDGLIERADLDGSGCGIWHMGTRRNPLPLMQQRAYPGLRRTQLDDEYLRELVDQKLKVMT